MNEDPEKEKPELKRFEWDLTPPLQRASDPEGWRLRRMEALEEVIRGPAPSEDWARAQEEYLDLRRGYSHDDEEEFGW